MEKTLIFCVLNLFFTKMLNEPRLMRFFIRVGGTARQTGAVLLVNEDLICRGILSVKLKVRKCLKTK